MKVLTRSRYRAAKSGSGRARSDRQRPAADCSRRQAIPLRNTRMIIGFAITRAGRRRRPYLDEAKRIGQHLLSFINQRRPPRGSFLSAKDHELVYDR
jgi:hypothetical protein